MHAIPAEICNSIDPQILTTKWVDGTFLYRDCVFLRSHSLFYHDLREVVDSFSFSDRIGDILAGLERE